MPGVNLDEDGIPTSGLPHQRPPTVATDPPDQLENHPQVVKTARYGELINEYRNAA